MRYVWIVLLLLAGSAVGEETPDWTGEWVTDLGLMELTQDGETVTGSYGKGGSLEGTAEGRKLAIRWRFGRGAGGGTLELAEDGSSFTGSWEQGKAGGGRWRGWRKDPDAEKGPPADFSGVWLSSLGTVDLTQEGNKVEGTYGSQGWGTVSGTVKGRRLSLTWKRIRWSGPAWLEMAPDGKRFFGTTEGDDPSKWLGARLEGYERDVNPKPEEVVRGLSESNMCYLLRAPKRWRKRKETDAIVLLHGSNWTTAGMVPVTARHWPEIGERFMLIGIQGESWVDVSDPEDPRFNYTYVNWMGRSTYEGYPYTDRESPYLVHRLVTQLKDRLNLGRIFVVGHSQGGFLAYYLLMHYPETFAGVAPMSCGLTIQCEPDVFDDEELRKAQRATPLALVHGTRDPQWGLKAGNYNYARFAASGFPMLGYFKKAVGHPYDYLPVGEAVRWMERMSAPDAKELVAFAKERAEAKAWRDVAALLLRADELRARRKLKAIEKELDAAAEKDAATHLAAIEKNEDSSWVDAFLEWRNEFEFAPAAEEVMAAFRDLRDAHEEPAKTLLGEARRAFQNGDRDAGWAKYEEIVTKYYASPMYAAVKGWLKNR
jgi:predicted esterase